MTHSVVVTCEHGGNDVPPRYRAPFRGREKLLASHRGWDPGAFELACDLAGELSAPLVASRVSRLLVDLNRSPNNPARWSVVSAALSHAEQRDVARRFHATYWRKVEQLVRRAASSGTAVHLSMHSFTPVLRGVRRTVDLGVLFDPERGLERTAAQSLMRELKREFPRLRVLANAPYKGTDDGLTTHLRTVFSATAYAGIEIEVNQRLIRRPSWASVRSRIVAAIGKGVHA